MKSLCNPTMLFIVPGTVPGLALCFILATAFLLPACESQRANEGAPLDEAVQPGGVARGESDLATQLIDVGGFRLHLRCQGEGPPTVVLDTGISETYRTWDTVLAEASREARVCGYDRAGYGESGAGPMPRSARQVARELATLLAEAESAAGFGPPYILVGHSLGALHSLVFAADHPQIVAGLVLVDPPPLDFLSGEVFPDLARIFESQVGEFRRAASESRASGELSAAIFFETLASEHEMMLSESLEAVSGITDLGDLPMIVISSGRPNPAFGDDAEAFQAFWIESNEEVAALSARGRFILAEQSGHHVHLDEPGVLMRAIREVISELSLEERPD